MQKKYYQKRLENKKTAEKIRKILGAGFEIRGLETALPANNPINKYSKFLKEIFDRVFEIEEAWNLG